jgi:hypothetical protein
MRNHRYILSIGLLVLALAWTLWFVFAGFGNQQDPLYWLYKYEHLEGGWMAAGTLLVGGAVVRLFGASLLPLRLFGWLCTVTAIALPYCCLLEKEQRRNNLHWLALAYVLMGYGAFQEFSPGTLSVLLLSAIWVSVSKSQIINHKSEIINLKSQILSAILLGMAVTVRFPNILVLLVLLPLWRKRSLWLLPVAAASAGIVYLLGYFFITPALTDAAMSSHEWLDMLSKLWTNGGKLTGFLLISLSVLALGQILNHKSQILNHKFEIINLKSEILGLAVGFLLAYFIAYATKPMQWYNTDLTYLISAFCLVLALASTKSKITNNKFEIINHKFEILSGAMILIIATLGTDTAWLKLFPAVLCLLPVAAAHYAPDFRRYLFAVMAVMSLFVAVRMATNSVGGSNLTQATTVATVAPYQGIAVREREEQWLHQIQTDLNEPMLNVLAVGQRMHLVRAVTGCRAGEFNEFWSNIYDSVYTDKYRPLIRAEHPVVVCTFSPQFKTKPAYTDRQSAFENMLREEGYREVDRSEYKYMIYIPNQSSEYDQ